MKARNIFSIVMISLLLISILIVPVRAGDNRSDYTGTVEFVSWTEPVPPVVTPGGTIHEQVVTEWLFNTTDSRLTGIYVFTGKCTWPHDKTGSWGPCQTTWTLDVNGDQQPDWEGVMSLSAQTKHDQWNGTGHGLGVYTGLQVSFKVYGIETVVGQVSGE